MDFDDRADRSGGDPSQREGGNKIPLPGRVRGIYEDRQVRSLLEDGGSRIASSVNRTSSENVPDAPLAEHDADGCPG